MAFLYPQFIVAQVSLSIVTGISKNNLIASSSCTFANTLQNNTAYLFSNFLRNFSRTISKARYKSVIYIYILGYKLREIDCWTTVTACALYVITSDAERMISTSIHPCSAFIYKTKRLYLHTTSSCGTLHFAVATTRACLNSRVCATWC